jgi:Ca2+-binding RTX toxin-like protein
VLTTRGRRTVATIVTGLLIGGVAGAGTGTAALAAPAAGRVWLVNGEVTFKAGARVENDLSVAVAGQVMTITDAAASVIVASDSETGCETLGARTVRCEGFDTVHLELGDYGDEAVIVSNRRVVVYGGTGNDTIKAGTSTGSLWVSGAAGDDTVTTGSGVDTLYGGDGEDHLVAGDGNDLVYGDAYGDVVFGGHGDDKVYGGTGDDHAYGGPGADTVDGEGGGDWVYGDQGDDLVYGREGNDWGYGGPGTDFLSMVAGNNQRAYGGTGYDYCRGDHLDEQDCEAV